MKNNPRLIIALVMVAGLALSSITAWLMYSIEEKAIVSEFKKEVDESAALLFREMAINFETLNTLSVLFVDNQVPSEAIFQREAQKILQRHPNIQGLEWIPRVQHKQREEYERLMQQQYPDFEFTERTLDGYIQTATDRADYYPVYYVVPRLGNERAHGFDFGSNQKRLTALELARDNASAQATGGVTLIQEQGKQQGFLAFSPVYKSGVPKTLSKRRLQLVGYVSGAFRIGDIFNSASLSKEPQGINMWLTDETDRENIDMLYIHKSRTGSALAQHIRYKKPLPDVLGRTWVITAYPTQSYLTLRHSFLPLSVFIAGLAVTSMFVFYVNAQSRRALIIAKVVEEKTHRLNEANRALKRLSLTDGLTGVSNRRFLDEAIEKEWLRAIRSKKQLTFVLLDIDYFKLFNDHYGHLSGDDCLKQVANCLKLVVKRPGDSIARYGGEEFALLLPETDHGVDLAEACRQAVENLNIPHELSEVCSVVTISLGVCSCLPVSGRNSKEMLAMADKALYQAKNSGRNQVKEITLAW